MDGLKEGGQFRAYWLEMAICWYERKKKKDSKE